MIEKITPRYKNRLFFIVTLFLSSQLFSQTADFKVQHIQDDIPRAGGTNTSFTPVASLNNAVALANNNRKTHAGLSNDSNPSGTTLNGRDMAGARVLTTPGTLTYYREAASSNNNMRFNTSIWEYVGPVGGANEMIVRGRYEVVLDLTNNSVTQAISGVSNANKCIPFITGIKNSATPSGADSGTAIAYLENASTLRVQKGTASNNVTVYITLVEFTGSNWTVLHGDSGNTGGTTGTITLKNGSDGIGTATDVSNWDDGIIFSHFRADTSSGNANLSDLWPILVPGSTNQSVDWSFNGDHNSNGTNRHFTHVLVNPNLFVKRFSTNTSSETGGHINNNINMTLAGLSTINEALIVGNSTSSGNGTAYGRGWRNYYLNSPTQAAHWAHRSGNTMAHEIQIVDLAGLTTTVAGPEINIQGNAANIPDGDTNPTTADWTDFGNNDVGVDVTRTFTIQNTGTANLNLTGASPYVVISGANAADFTVTTAPGATVAAGGNTTFVVTFNPSTAGTRNATISITNNDSNENPYNFSIQGTGIVGPPKHTIYYENFDENNGSWTASTGQPTNWSHGTGLTAATVPELGEGSYWYTNNYNNYANNTFTTVVSPILSTLGFENLVFSADVRYNLNADADDGMVVQYRKRTSGVWSAWSILGSDTSGTNWYDGNGTVDAIALGSDGWTGDTSTTQAIKNFFKTAANPLPLVLNDAAEIQFRFVFASDGGTTDDGAAFDNILIYADPIVPFSDPVIGPGSMNSELKLWLKATAELGVATNGTAINVWNDQAFDNDAIGLTSNSPSFEDNNVENINFNPVIKFDRSTKEFMRGKGGYFSHDYFVVIKSNGIIDNNGTNRQVPIAGRVADISPQVDGTGLGLGNISARFTNEVVAHMASSVPTAANTTSYGKAFTSTTKTYTDEVIIYNVKTNTSHTETEIYKNGIRIDNILGQAVDLSNGTFTGPLNFSEFINQQFYVGIGRFSLNGNVDAYVDGKISEIISYAATNSTLGQNKIQSYLALKNGITLHASNSVTADNLNDVNYIDSQGNIIWNTTVNTGYNYDIAGIGRDDASALNQKQSKSVNNASDGSGPTQGILTMGLADIYATNSENITTNAANTFNDKEFLVWGNNGVNLDLAATVISVNMSSGITPALTTDVTFTGMQRIWKVVETGGDVKKVKVSIPQNAVRNISPPGSFLMFISDTGIFDPTADYRVMTQSGGNLYADYDFDGTKYITFGYAPEIIVERSIYFDGAVDYVDMEDALDLNPTEFTVSAWIKRGAGASNKSILSKRDATYTEGYDFKITSGNKLEMSWGNAGAQKITSNTNIPQDKWHHVAVIYDGGSAKLYIDGVLDKTTPLSNPVATSQSFFIAAAGKNTPQAFFEGNIDEVRVWDIALSEDQLRYIMNQELIDKNNIALPLIKGNVIPTAITKNEISAIPWAALAGYYPLSVYTYTNTNDMSGNGHQGALRNLETVDRQTAPLPYVSDNDGAWDTPATWLNNTVQDLPNSASIVDGVTPIDWNIVQTTHDITSGARDITVLGLKNNAGKLTIDGTTNMATGTGTGHGLHITHYLELDGRIDLEGESQLIQDEGSILDADSGGDLERDQQGTANSFNYNYWSSSVGPKALAGSSTTGTGLPSVNEPFTIKGIINDGRAATPPGIVYNTSPYAADSGSGLTLTISSYWLYKFYGKDNDYNSWFPRISQTSNLAPGVGYTMKGSSGKVPITKQQNYVFKGKPNNGDVTLPLIKGTGYVPANPAGEVNRLIGNPYPSALDAHEFILDNLSGGHPSGNNIFNGALYFWDHFGQRDTHILREYVGGYATRNLTAGAPAISNDSRINHSGGPETINGVGKTPGQFIPVGQGFFVGTALAASLTGITTVTGGDIVFKNSQRVFQRESATIGGPSVFMKAAKTKNNQKTEENTNTHPIIRLLFDSPTGYHRQIVMGMVENTSNHFDLGYDAPTADINKEDMYWTFDGAKFVIQGVPNFDENQEFPLALIVSKLGLARIKIEELENMDDNISIYIKDKLLDKIHNISQNPFEIELEAGTYNDRFAVIFKMHKLVEDDVAVAITEETQLLIAGIQVFMDNTIGELQIKNTGDTGITNIALYNYLGQTIKTWKSNLNRRTVSLPINAASGVYLLQINTKTGVLNTKIIVE